KAQCAAQGKVKGGEATASTAGAPEAQSRSAAAAQELGNLRRLLRKARVYRPAPSCFLAVRISAITPPEKLPNVFAGRRRLCYPAASWMIGRQSRWCAAASGYYGSDAVSVPP